MKLNAERLIIFLASYCLCMINNVFSAENMPPGVIAAAHSQEGTKQRLSKQGNEDTWAAFSIGKKDAHEMVFGVFDGHGGSGASNFMRNKFPEYYLRVTKDSYYQNKDLYHKLHAVLCLMDVDFLTLHLQDYSGTTACVAVVQRYNDKKCPRYRIYIANTGDSRAECWSYKKISYVASSNLLLQTKDHVPILPDESNRITSAGLDISYEYGCYRVQGGLAMSRSIGDRWYKFDRIGNPCRAVIADPNIYIIDPVESMATLILASDGYWHIAGKKNQETDFEKSAQDKVQNAIQTNFNSADRTRERLITVAGSQKDFVQILPKTLADHAVQYKSKDDITIMAIQVHPGR